METLPNALLDWFAQNRRSLPFREEPTPYHIWLSEIMLQQTRMAAVLPYYTRFLAECPDIPALAACPEARLQKLWEGLGYYSRMRNLQKAARVVCEQYGGQLPADYAALLALPGIGAYTAGAIASIGFGIAVPAVDGNVVRVLARLDAEKRCVAEPAVKSALTQRAAALLPPEAPGDFNQALMELGALVCVPNGAPLCGACPWQNACKAHALGIEQQLPVKLRAKARRLVPVAVALVRGPAGWLLRRRPEKGLLAGLWGPVTWEDTAFADVGEMRAALAALGIETAAPYGGAGRLARQAAPGAAQAPQAQTAQALQRASGTLAAPLAVALPAAKHVFTHLEWHMAGWQLCAPAQPLPEGFAWATPAQLETEFALPGAFRVYRKHMMEN